MNMDIKPFVNSIERLKFNVEGIHVFQHSKEIAKHRWVPEQVRTIYSVSKSFVSIAAGMAIDEGKLKLKDKVTKVVPGNPSDPRWDSITLQHLLTMSIGSTDFYRPQSVEEAYSYKLTAEAGERFTYDNTCTFLASVMITKVTGLKVRDYLVTRLFRPLGIPDPQWAESADGYTIGANGLELTTSQLATFGRFLLQRGNWDGKQLVSASWIDAASRTQVPTWKPNAERDYDIGYGYQFWTCRHGAYRCDGKDGQFVIVFPALDAVVAINANEADPEPILYAVWDHVLPQLQDLC